MTPYLFLPADLGFPGLWRVPSQATGLCADPGLSADPHQPRPAFPLWTGQPGAEFGDRAGTWDRGCFRTSNGFRSRVSFGEWGSRWVKLGVRVRLWFRCRRGGWTWAGGCTRSGFPRSWYPKEAVPPGTTEPSGLTDTTETQLRPGGQLRKRWRGEESERTSKILMFYPAVCLYSQHREAPTVPSSKTPSGIFTPLTSREGRTVWRKRSLSVSLSLHSLWHTSGAFWTPLRYNL